MVNLNAAKVKLSRSREGAWIEIAKAANRQAQVASLPRGSVD